MYNVHVCTYVATTLLHATSCTNVGYWKKLHETIRTHYNETWTLQKWSLTGSVIGRVMVSCCPSNFHSGLSGIAGTWTLNVTDP